MSTNTCNVYEEYYSSTSTFTGYIDSDSCYHYTASTIKSHEHEDEEKDLPLFNPKELVV